MMEQMLFCQIGRKQCLCLRLTAGWLRKEAFRVFHQCATTHAACVVNHLPSSLVSTGWQRSNRSRHFILRALHWRVRQVAATVRHFFNAACFARQDLTKHEITQWWQQTRITSAQNRWWRQPTAVNWPPLFRVMVVQMVRKSPLVFSNSKENRTV